MANFGPVHPLIDVALQRVWDPHATATPRATVLDFFSRAQNLVNGALDAVLATRTLNTTPYRQVYQLADIGHNILRIKTVQYQHRDLSRIEFNRLKLLDSRWFGATGDRFRTWATLGREMLIVHPGSKRADQVDVVYTRVLPVLDSEDDDILLPTDLVPALLKVVELLLLVKARDLLGITNLATELARDFGLAREDPTTQTEVKQDVESLSEGALRRAGQ